MEYEKGVLIRLKSDEKVLSRLKTKAEKRDFCLARV